MDALKKAAEIYTPDEYLEYEREANERREFVDGYLIEMAGESLSHSRICVSSAR